MRTPVVALAVLALSAPATAAPRASSRTRRPPASDGGMPTPGAPDGGPPSSGLDKDTLRTVIHQERLRFRFCYESLLPRFPNLQGKVIVQFAIAPGGIVTDPQVKESTVDNAELERCLLDQVARLRFPDGAPGSAPTRTLVTYPFLFQHAPPSADAGSPIPPSDAGTPDAGTP